MRPRIWRWGYLAASVEGEVILVYFWKQTNQMIT